MHPYGYPQLIKDKDVKNIWSGTRVKSGNKKQMIGSLNNALKSLYGYDLLKQKKRRRGTGRLPVRQRGPINVSRAQPRAQPQQQQQQPQTQPQPQPQPRAPMAPPRAPQPPPSSVQVEPPSSPKPTKQRMSLPTKPSSAPPIQYDSDDSSSSSSSDSEERRRRKRGY